MTADRMYSAERRAAEYIRSRFNEYELAGSAIEEFDLKIWESSSSSISIIEEEDRVIDVHPSLFYPVVSVTGPTCGRRVWYAA